MLNFAHCSNISDSSIHNLTKNNTHSHTLSVPWYIDISNSSVINVANNCRNLCNLNLRGIRIGDSSLLRLAEKCPLLDTIDLSHCQELTLGL